MSGITTENFAEESFKKAIDRTPNQYNIMDWWYNEVAPKYFDMKNQNINRTGLFGHTNEIMSHSVESILNENAVMMNEQFFKRAKLPSTIFSNAAHYNIDNFTAVPSRMEFVIMLNEKELLDNSVTVEGDTYFLIDDDSTIFVEDRIRYSLDYDIKISIKQDRNLRYVYSARYLTSGLSNPLSPIQNSNNPYLRLTKIRQGRETYVAIYVSCAQINKIVRNKKIYSADLIDYFSFDVAYPKTDGEIAGFNVYYKETNVPDFIQLEKKPMDGEESDNPFCFFQYKGDNTINISFSAITRYFKPKLNSELLIEIYNTSGSNGVFTYSGSNVKMKLQSEKYEYRNMIAMVEPIGDSLGGRDTLSYEQIKDLTSMMASTVDNISTEGDLTNLFKSIEGTSDTSFIKKRDDIQRMFGGYMLLKDEKKDIIPTNSIEMELSEEDFDINETYANRYVLNAGRQFVYKPDSHVVTPITAPQDPEFLFTNPFTMVVNRKPLYMSYYCTSIKKTYAPDFAEINDMAFVNFIVNKITIDRNALQTDKYTIRFTTMPNTDDLEIDFAEFDITGEFIQSNNNMKAKGVLYGGESEVTHYFDIKMVNYNKGSHLATFEGTISSDDYISPNGYIRITDGLTDMADPTNSRPMIKGDKLKVGIFIYLHKDIAATDQINKYDEILPGTEEYEIVNIYNIDSEVDIINNMNNIMYSDVLMRRVGMSHKYNYMCKEVPVVSKDFMDNSSSGTEFFTKFLSNIEVMKQYLNKLTNAFALSAKLYNTYGKSKFLYVYGNPNYALDRMNLTMNFKIHLNPDKTNDEITKMSIKNYIVSYIENLNEKEGENFYVSNLIKTLENMFRDIRWIQFLNINDYGAEVQSIEKNFPSTNTRDFIPEYLTVHKTYNKSTGDTKYSINIDFV